MQTNEEDAPAVDALREWIEGQGLTPNAWAIANGLDPSTVSRILRGQSRPSLELSIKIERLTGGAVPVAMWVRAS